MVKRMSSTLAKTLGAVGYLSPGRTLPGLRPGSRNRRGLPGLWARSTTRAHALIRRLLIATGYGELAAELVALATARHAREAALRDLPAGPSREFWAWVFSARNPYQRDWLQAAGCLQTGKLIVGLLGDLVEPHRWPAIADRVGIMCAYQAFEVVSDNLAIGVARPGPVADTTRDARRRLLLRFDDAMIHRLRGHGRPAHEALRWVDDVLDEGISLVSQSLAPDITRRMMECFATERDDPALFDHLQHDLRAALTLNIELCEQSAVEIEHSALAELAREGLIARYRAVTDGLRNPRAAPETLATRGMHTILVVPTLAVVLAVWSEVAGWAHRLEDPHVLGLLHGAMEDSAALVRLTNDLGYPLLQCSPHQRQRFFQQHVSTTDRISFAERLREVAPRHVELTRIHKDLLHGEFNVWLDSFELEHEVHAVEAEARAALDWLARHYQHLRERLDDRLGALAESTGDDTVGVPIVRFVEFHEMVYSHDFETKDGEYAI